MVLKVQSKNVCRKYSYLFKCMEGMYLLPSEAHLVSCAVFKSVKLNSGCH